MAWSRPRARGHPPAAEQGDLKRALELLGQKLAEEGLAGARGPDEQTHPFGPLDAPRQSRPGGLDAGGRKVLIQPRHAAERPAVQIEVGFVHGRHLPPNSTIAAQQAIAIRPAAIQSLRNKLERRDRPGLAGLVAGTTPTTGTVRMALTWAAELTAGSMAAPVAIMPTPTVVVRPAARAARASRSRCAQRQGAGAGAAARRPTAARSAAPAAGSSRPRAPRRQPAGWLGGPPRPPPCSLFNDATGSGLRRRRLPSRGRGQGRGRYNAGLPPGIHRGVSASRPCSSARRRSVCCTSGWMGVRSTSNFARRCCKSPSCRFNATQSGLSTNEGVTGRDGRRRRRPLPRSLQLLVDGGVQPRRGLAKLIVRPGGGRLRLLIDLLRPRVPLLAIPSGQRRWPGR